MKKIYSLFLFFSFFVVFAQNKIPKDVIYLKNGSQIRGTIIEQIPNESVKIETADKNIFVYQFEEIEKMEKLVGGNGMKKGYKGIVELGYEIGTGDYGMDRLKLNIINGYQFNPYFSMGFGIGVRYYFDFEELLIPIFTDFQVNFIDKQVSPYFSFDVGYSISATGDISSGLLLNPTAGVSIKISDNNFINAGLGFEHQGMKGMYSYYNSYGDIIHDDSKVVSSDAISFNVGFVF